MPPSFRYLLRLLGTFIARFKGILFLGIVIGIILFVFIRLFGSPFLVKKTERIGLVGKYTTANLPNFILAKVGRGLTKTLISGQVEPDLAANWESGENGKVWIFHLKENEKWQDGKTIVAQNLNFNFSDVTVEKPDSQTIIFRLQNPFSPFPFVVSKPIFKKGFLGSGEWEIKKISISGNFVQRLTLANSKGERQTYKFYPTEERAKLGFKLGEVDKLIDIYNPSPLDAWPGNLLDKEADETKIVAIFFNTGPTNKLLSEKSFRQALAYALNKNDFTQNRAVSPLSPLSWAYNPQVKPYDYDQVKAGEIIKGLPSELKDNLALKLVTTPVLLNQAEKISRDWEAVGVTTTLQVSSTVPTEFDALLLVFDIPLDPDQYAFWHSSQKASNITSYNNPRIDKLLEDGRTELNQEARKKIYLDFQRFLVEDSPTIFLYHPISYTIERK
jgi:peptide/nickel transport system substrate-binding protein